MRTPRRRGFTIIELLFTLVLLGAGLLALHGSAALTLRLIGGGWTRTLTATTAQARLDQLRAAACTGISSGSDETRGVRQEWTVSPARTNGSTSFTDIELTVTYTLRAQRGPPAQRSAAFRATVPCG
ncbi:MAG: prepilin-type N-terminal cleavage/methylation domain-containing protein [Gemmatimonadaceae bacterium]